jgi:hypothetical protein
VTALQEALSHVVDVEVGGIVEQGVVPLSTYLSIALPGSKTGSGAPINLMVTSPV